jgi:hypothetical protein
MSAELIQRPLFDDPIGQRFTLAREKARLSKPSVAKQLRLPLVVIEAIENEDWARLGAPIYVRSYIGSYARLLGLPPETGEDIACGKPLPALVPIAIRSRARRLWDRSAFNLASLATSAVIVGSIALLAARFLRCIRVSGDGGRSSSGFADRRGSDKRSVVGFADAGPADDASGGKRFRRTAPAFRRRKLGGHRRC